MRLPAIPGRAGWAAIIASVTALAVYVPTLYPGVALVGGDSAKFQYLGSVLGTAHPPGYPLYIVLSYAFSKVPIGTMAYRMNLLSALFSSAAVALVLLTLVRLRCHLLVAASTALAFGFGRYLWERSLSAEVYTLGAALAALIVWLAVRWAESGRDRDLYLTAAAFGLSLGNHLTIATIAPALAIFVLLTRPQRVTIRTTTACFAIALLGLAQYGFILLRTWQQAPYVEARASNLGELFDVLRASRYSHQMFGFSMDQLLGERLPRLWQVLFDEMGPLGLTGWAVGLIACVWRRRSVGVLLVMAFAGIAALTLTVDADVEGFLLTGFVFTWLLAGVGWQAAWSLASRHRVTQAIAGLVIVAVPIGQVTANYRRNDHHRRTYEIEYLDALFRQFEPRVAVVSEQYLYDQMLYYKLVGEQAARGRRIEIVEGDLATIQRYARDGYTIYAFGSQRAALEEHYFRFAPVQLFVAKAGPAGARLEPIDMAISLGRLVDWSPCATVGNLGWQDITGLVAGDDLRVRLDNYRPFEAILVLYVAGSALSAPAIGDLEGPVPPSMTVATFRTSQPAGIAGLTAALARDQVPEPDRFTRHAVAHRIELRVNDQGQFSRSVISLGGHPAALAARATVDLNNPRRAVVCGTRAPRPGAPGL